MTAVTGQGVLNTLLSLAEGKKWERVLHCACPSLNFSLPPDLNPLMGIFKRDFLSFQSFYLIQLLISRLSGVLKFTDQS